MHRCDRPGNAYKEFHDRAAATASLSELPFHSVVVGMVDLWSEVNDVLVLSVKMLCRWPHSLRFLSFPMAASFILFLSFFLYCAHVAQPECLLIRNTANVQRKTALRGSEDGDQERDGESQGDQESSRGSDVSNNVSHVRITIFS